MSFTNEELVLFFHDEFDCPINEKDTPKLRMNRAKLVAEEAFELVEALVGTTEADALFSSIGMSKSPMFTSYVTKTPGSLAEVAKESADLKYVTYGTDVTFGVDAAVAFTAVHESNMSKLGPDGKPIYREDGKVLKGPNYQEADVTEALP